MMTLNLHNFSSLVKNMDKQAIMEKSYDLIKKYDLDLCCF